MNRTTLAALATLPVVMGLAGQLMAQPPSAAAHGPTLLPRPTATAVPFLPGAPKHPTAPTPARAPTPTPTAAAPTPRPPAKPAAKKATKKKPAAAKAPVAYVQAMNGWHKADATETPEVDERGVTRLVLHCVNTRERVAISPSTTEGGFRALELERAAHLLRDPSNGGEHPVEPRLLDFAYKIQRHFDAPLVRVISGYRTPHGGHSNHGRGRAIDLVVPGVKDEDVASFARQEGFSGVGVYPVSGFVHVDVRERSYFWLDASGPGRKNRERGILPDVAAKSDVNAQARGFFPMPRYGCGADVSSALGATLRSQSPELHSEDEEDASEESP